MQIAATTSSATLRGQLAIPLSVAGVTTAPSRIPTSTKHKRASGNGIFTAQPPNAATATVSIEPETSPPGKPMRWKPIPPTAATSNVPATCISSRSGETEGGIDWSRTLRSPGKARPAVRFEPPINGACGALRQMAAHVPRHMRDPLGHPDGECRHARSDILARPFVR